MRRLFFFFLLSVFLSVCVSAQQVSHAEDSGAGEQQSSAGADSSSASAAQSSQQSPSPNTVNSSAVDPVRPAAPNSEEQIQKAEQSQRILGVMPQFNVTSRRDAPPLTTGQKFRLFAKGAFDPFEFGFAGLQAGISQAQDEFPGYGQGLSGYGKRYGASFADLVSGNFFANFVYPTLLKEGPRYFRLGEGPVRHRILYSVAQEFVCRTDKGGRSFNWSNVLGAFSTGGLSNLYYPRSDRGFGLTMSRSAISLAYGSAGGLLGEFWPDIRRKLFHRHRREADVDAGGK